jgi:hypothetical protein
MMVESWSPEVFYSKYFPAVNQQVVHIHTEQGVIFFPIVPLIVGLVGGMTIFLKLVISSIVKIHDKGCLL